jgi:hypothetical protein
LPCGISVVSLIGMMGGNSEVYLRRSLILRLSSALQSSAPSRLLSELHVTERETFMRRNAPLPRAMRPPHKLSPEIDEAALEGASLPDRGIDHAVQSFPERISEGAHLTKGTSLAASDDAHTPFSNF